MRDRGKDARADMAMTWTKIKLWTKVSVFGAVAIYVIAFVLLNRHAVIDKDLDFVFKTYERPNALLVLLLTALFSIFGWWLFKTVFKTLRQMRDVKRRAHLERIEKEHADMVAKAAKLQTRPGAGDAA
jgi:hypothetical protein